MDTNAAPKGLDKVDLRILDALLKNGRMTNRDLARAVGITEPTCVQRRKRLERLGVIKGYTIVIDPEQFASTLHVWFTVRLLGASTGEGKAFQALLAQEIGIVSIFTTSGGADYLIEALAENYALARALKSRLEERRDLVAQIQMLPVFDHRSASQPPKP